MAGKAHWVDNVFVERVSRTVKHEDIYLRAHETPAALRAGLNRHFRFNNTRRGHAALGRQNANKVNLGTISSLPKAA